MENLPLQWSNKGKKGDLEGAFQDLSKSEMLCRHSQSEVTFEIALVLQKMKKDKDALDKAREAMIKAKNSKNGLIQALSCALIYKITGKMECGKGIICSNFNLIKEKIGELNNLKMLNLLECPVFKSKEKIA
ncbi:hypothetical protein [Sulfuracidifex metallicus]|uniref:hypothetical protein n=1 Tax=Sulfuracidifex metallicus TaxID=47303 RepID=UPI0006D1B476|nr:hypothetical protein [Sulfuracidifex metallicus]